MSQALRFIWNKYNSSLNMYLLIWNYVLLKNNLIMSTCNLSIWKCTYWCQHAHILWKNATYDINSHVKLLAILDLFCLLLFFIPFKISKKKSKCYMVVLWQLLNNLTIFPAKKKEKNSTQNKIIVDFYCTIKYTHNTNICW